MASDSSLTDPGLVRQNATRVVFVTYSFGSGGAEKQLLWMARILAQHGAKCTIMELKSSHSNARFEEMVRATKSAGVELSYASEGESYLGVLSRVGKAIRSEERPIVWSWGYKADLITYLCGQWRRGQLWICSLRSANEKRIRSSGWMIRLRGRRVTRYVSNTWSNCYLVDLVRPGTLANCRVVYNVVEELSTTPVDLPIELPRPLRIVMLGNIVAGTKGYDLAIDLAERVLKAGKTVEFHVAGRSDGDSWLPTEILRHGLQSKFFYHGETGDPQTFLRSGHVYLLMSRFEGTPNALLEAASAGLPIIATRVGDLSRMAVDGKHMRLVPINDVDAAYNALIDMIENWLAAIAMGRRSREWCETNFSATTGAAALVRVVNELQPLHR